LQRAVDCVVERHESLRTRFDNVDGELLQSVEPLASLPVLLRDISSLDDEERELACRRYQREVQEMPFALDRGPLLRCMLLRLSSSTHLMIIGLHHIAFDAWSGQVLLRDLGIAYRAFIGDQPPEWPAMPIQYKDYAVWQREQLSTELVDRQLDYWRDRLAGVSVLELPTDRPRQAFASHDGAVCTIELGKALSAGLRNLARQHDSTLFMALLAGFLVVLHRYSGQDDIAVGTAISNRARPELEPLIGLFINTLVLRTNLAGDPTFAELVTRVRETALGAYAHQALPFEKLVEELDPQRDMSRNPLFQVGCSLRGRPRPSRPLAALESGQLSLTVVPDEVRSV